MLALIGMGAAAWACQPRDDFIGWSPGARKAQLHLVVANARFLVLPWVQVLAHPDRGRTRPAGPRGIGQDGAGRSPRSCWRPSSRRPLRRHLLRAAKGRGKLGRTHRNARAVKEVHCCPLTPDFRPQLGTGRVAEAPGRRPTRKWPLGASMDNRRNAGGPGHY